MLPLKWRQTFWRVLVRQICVCQVTIVGEGRLCLNFIVVAVRYCLGQQDGWCQMGVSETSFVCDPSNVCFWGGSLGEVRCLFLNLHPWLWSIRCLFLRWITVDEVGCLCLKLHHCRTFDKVRRLFLELYHWHWYHSVFVTIGWYLGSLMAQGSCFVTMS